MIKTGRIEPGKTPSTVSGRPSEVIRKGEPVRRDEKTPERTISKVAKQLGKVDA